MKENPPKYIGLTGLNASGKGTAAQYLIDKGYTYYSLSDIVREEAAALGRDHSRENLIYVGNKLRKEQGPAVLAKRIVEKIVRARGRVPVRVRVVIDSIRNAAETNELRKLPGFILIGVDAPVEIRFKRAKNRGRVGFEKSLQEFIAVEQKENSEDPNKQQLFECLKMADFKIINDGTEEELKSKINSFFRK
ncbi:MAG: AAA family ATPase [Candidatus Margulisiibacteriota bacterium]